MNLPIIVGGSPGCGKTTLCKRLSQASERGVHIATDTFFHFIAQVVDPSTPAATRQNHAVIDAYCAAAKAYVLSDYVVYIDGVIGPWHFQRIVDALGPFHYILLHAPLPVTHQRVAERDTQSSARPSVVDRMHPKFESVLKPFASHVLMTESVSPEQLVPLALSRIASGGCVIERA